MSIRRTAGDLCSAARKGDVATVSSCLEAGVPIDCKDGNEQTALHLASWKGEVDTAKLLLDEGASVDVQDGFGETALHVASANGKVDTAKLLLDKRASVDAQDGSGRTPLMLASNCGCHNVVATLLNHGASVNLQDKYGDTALIGACRQGHEESAQLLLTTNADVNILNTKGQTALTVSRGKLNEIIQAHVAAQQSRSKDTPRGKGGSSHVAALSERPEARPQPNKPQQHRLQRIQLPQESQVLLESAQAEIERLQNQVRRQAEQLEAKDQQIRGEQETSQLSQESQVLLESAQAEIERLQNQVRRQAEQLEAKDQQIRGEQQTSQLLQESQVLLESTQAEIERLQNQVQRQAEQLEAEDQQIRGEQQTSQQLRRNNDQLQEQVQLQQMRTNTLQQQLNAAQQQIQETGQALLDAHQQHQLLQQENLQLRQQLRTTETQLQARLQHSHLTEFWEVPREDVTLNMQWFLGTGAWGFVVEEQFRGQKVAVKCLHHLIRQPAFIRVIRQEIGIMAQLRHPNLVMLIAAVIGEGGPPLIITELLDTSLLRAYERGRLEGSSKLSIFRDIASALNYLHLHHHGPIIHRDVSSANVLLEAKPNNQWKAKLSDFGSAKLVREARTIGPGAVVYSAPEVRTQTGIPQSPKVDVYSFGVLMCEVTVNEFPSEERFPIMAQTASERWPPIFLLITACIQQHPSNRPYMASILGELDRMFQH